MSVRWIEGYSAAMRKYIAENGRPGQVQRRWLEPRVSAFGWEDNEAIKHIRKDKCSWIVPEGAAVEEFVYSEFDGTDCDNRMEIGINTDSVDCACGKYMDITLRVNGSLSDAIKYVCNYDPKRIII